MVRNIRLVRIFWGITAAFAFLSALAGILSRDIYSGVFAVEFLPGAFAQDVVTLLVSLVLFILIRGTWEGDFRKQIVIVGLIGSLFYLYGIFTMERVYNWYYLLYAGVFGSSFWSLVYSLSGYRTERLSAIRTTGTVVKVASISSIVIALLFTALWVSALIPLMREHNRIEFLYSIYVLDLCFVMPAFFITAVMSLRGMPMGILMTPAIMITGFFVIFPLGLNELAKPSAGMEMNVGSMVVSFAFSSCMFALAIWQLWKLYSKN